MKSFSLLAAILFVSFCATAQVSKTIKRKATIKSPDGKVAAEILLDKNQQLVYNTSYAGEAVMESSRLGVVREDADFSTGMQWISSSKQSTVKDYYNTLNAKKTSIDYLANKRIIAAANKEGNKMNIVFLVWC